MLGVIYYVACLSNTLFKLFESIDVLISVMAILEKSKPKNIDTITDKLE